MYKKKRNWGNKWVISGYVRPKKTRQKCQAPMLKITGVISGIDIPKDETKAIPSPLAKRLNQVTGLIPGDVTPKDKINILSLFALNN